MFEIVFLGTAGMVPTAQRNHIATLVKHDKESILVDCGEGTQRQFKYAKEDMMRVSKILISHWHGDHILGLPGMLQSLKVNGYAQRLDIYGPAGSKLRFEHMFKAFAFDSNMDLVIHEVKDGIIAETDLFTIEAHHLKHSIACFGYAIKEKDKLRINVDAVRKIGIPDGPLLGKLQAGHDVEFKGKKVAVGDVTYTVHGKKVAIVMDTEPCEGALRLAQDADVLIADSMHLNNIEHKAEEYMHLTARQAAQIASNANAKKLILNHFSQRYKSTIEHEEEAKEVFPNTIAAYDLMKVKIK